LPRKLFSTYRMEERACERVSVFVARIFPLIARKLAPTYRSQVYSYPSLASSLLQLRCSHFPKRTRSDHFTLHFSPFTFLSFP
jgi:hypothetical protein